MSRGNGSWEMDEEKQHHAKEVHVVLQPIFHKSHSMAGTGGPKALRAASGLLTWALRHCEQ
eukprot:4187379-Prorocentrum_lima.AAC.1